MTSELGSLIYRTGGCCEISDVLIRLSGARSGDSSCRQSSHINQGIQFLIRKDSTHNAPPHRLYMTEFGVTLRKWLIPTISTMLKSPVGIFSMNLIFIHMCKLCPLAKKSLRWPWAFLQSGTVKLQPFFQREEKLENWTLNMLSERLKSVIVSQTKNAALIVVWGLNFN